LFLRKKKCVKNKEAVRLVYLDSSGFISSHKILFILPAGHPQTSEAYARN
jgi:hypothetical protein